MWNKSQNSHRRDLCKDKLLNPCGQNPKWPTRGDYSPKAVKFLHIQQYFLCCCSRLEIGMLLNPGMATELHKQFPKTILFPWQFPDFFNFPYFSLTSFKFTEISRFSRQAVTLSTMCHSTLVTHSLLNSQYTSASLDHIWPDHACDLWPQNLISSHL